MADVKYELTAEDLQKILGGYDITGTPDDKTIKNISLDIADRIFLNEHTGGICGDTHDNSSLCNCRNTADVHCELSPDALAHVNGGCFDYDALTDYIYNRVSSLFKELDKQSGMNDRKIDLSGLDYEIPESNLESVTGGECISESSSYCPTSEKYEDYMKNLTVSLMRLLNSNPESENIAFVVDPDNRNLRLD